MVALETAMDELAYAVNIDPLELRLRNYAEVEPVDGRPYSSKKLRECYLEGARRFGWERRPMQPRSLRDGRLLIGWGMASAMMNTFRFAASARVCLRSDGKVIVQCGAQDCSVKYSRRMSSMVYLASGIAGYPRCCEQ